MCAQLGMSSVDTRSLVATRLPRHVLEGGSSKCQDERLRCRSGLLSLIMDKGLCTLCRFERTGLEYCSPCECVHICDSCPAEVQQ